MTDKNVDIAALAKLARLEVSPEELTKLEREIPDILSFVETVHTASAGGTVATTSKHRNIMRQDENPHEAGQYTETLLKAAPTRAGNRIAVKQVISRKKK